MKLPKIFGIEATLTTAILIERWFGIPFVLEGKGLEGYPAPWWWLRIVLNADEIVWLIHRCAEVGARADLMFLNEVLAQMVAP